MASATNALLPAHLVLDSAKLHGRGAMNLFLYWNNKVTGGERCLHTTYVDLPEWSDEQCRVRVVSYYTQFSARCNAEAETRLSALKNWDGLKEWFDCITISTDNDLVVITSVSIGGPKIFGAFATSNSFWTFCVLKYGERVLGMINL